eukprot:m.226652 g.226652  ORF g.226652 m.226652 type:complete len:629 (+) comp22362_c1_seq6:89-1975(+)
MASYYNNFTPGGGLVNSDSEDEENTKIQRQRTTKRNSKLNKEMGMSRLAQGASKSFRGKKDSTPSVSSLRQADKDWEVDAAKLSGFKEIGQGNFGVVYLAQLDDGKNKYTVAVKTLSETDKDLEQEFRKEANVMKAIDAQHNIVRLIGLCTKKAPCYMIMEYMPRGDLKGVLRSHRPAAGKPSPLSYRQLAKMGVDIAEGMSYLESIKIVHRDLAARNVLVAQDYTCKIGDFGLTRDVYHREYYRMHGAAPLPIRWMAPESLADGVFTSSSDLWSFGVVLWEIVTFGKTPYSNMNNMEVAEMVVEEEYRMPSPTNCPEPLYKVMVRCWQEEPQDRGSFADAMHKLQDCTGLLSDKPIEIFAASAKDLSGSDYAMPQDAVQPNAGVVLDGYDSAAEEAKAKAAAAAEEEESGDVYDLAEEPEYDLAHNPGSDAAAEEEVTADPLYDMGMATEYETAPKAKAAPKAAAKLKDPKEKAKAAESAAEFGRRSSQSMAGLRNDSSATAAKVTAASQESAEKAYADIMAWISRVTGHSFAGQSLEEGLKAGDVLCELVNKIKPGLIPKYHKGTKLAFKQMENIGLFLNACKAYGLVGTQLFITIDLFEAQNVKAVVSCLSALRSKAQAQGFKDP